MDPRLVEAAKSGDVNYLLCLIREDSLLLESVALAGAETPLHVASMCGRLPFVQEMLKWRRQFAYDLNQDGFTPLHLASANGYLSVVLELLKEDPDFCSIQGWENRIALHCAVVKGRIEVTKELLSASPDTVEMKTLRGETALHLAVKNNQLGAFQLLVDHVKKFKKEQVLNEKDNQGNTILHLAASRKQYQVIHLLLVDDAVKLHLELNSTNYRGLTPLDVLVLFPSEAGDLEIHRKLLEAGAKAQHEAPFSDRPNYNLSTTQAEIVTANSNNGDDNNKTSNEAGQLDESAASALSDVRNSLLMTAVTLIATATYQAVLSPPSGLWQDDAPDANPPHFAGKSVLATNNPRGFIFFVVGNSIGLHLSLSSILLLTKYHYALSFSLYFVISFTYSLSVGSITPADGSLARVVPPTLTVLAFILPSLNAILWSLSKRRAQQNLNP